MNSTASASNEELAAKLTAVNDWLINSRLTGHELAALVAANWVLEAATRLRAAEAEAGRVGVKALKWRKPTDHPQDNEDAILVASGLGGQYSITDGSGDFLLWNAEDNFVWTAYPTVTAAKAAAQQDYETRIRSTLTAPPAAEVTDEMVERLPKYRFDSGNHTWGTDGGSMCESEDGDWIKLADLTAALAGKEEGK